MKKSFSCIIFFLAGSLLIYGQPAPDYEKEINVLNGRLRSLQSENGKLKINLENLNKELTNISNRLDSVKEITNVNTQDISSTRSNLGLKITETGKASEDKITEVNKSLSKNTLYWIIAFLATALLSGLVYFLLGKRIKTGKKDVEEQILRTNKSLEEEGIKLDTKLTEVLETQLKLVQAERSNNITSTQSEETDHSLALKVADELMRLSKNISHMDSNTKGLKQLSASVKRIEDNFAANGYEMPELLNKPFDPRMKLVVANSIPDENLKKGEEIITRIIKPQVNYKGVMIQSAQVEISVGQN
jgi:hypothetical protein